MCTCVPLHLDIYTPLISFPPQLLASAPHDLASSSLALYPPHLPQLAVVFAVAASLSHPSPTPSSGCAGTASYSLTLNLDLDVLVLVVVDLDVLHVHMLISSSVLHCYRSKADAAWGACQADANAANAGPAAAANASSSSYHLHY